MRILVAVVHAIGEDNEGNTSVVATTNEELDAKLLALFREWTDEPIATLEDAQDMFHWNVDEHEIA